MTDVKQNVRVLVDPQTACHAIQLLRTLQLLSRWLTVHEQLAYSGRGADGDGYFVVGEELDLFFVLHVLGEQLEYHSATGRRTLRDGNPPWRLVLRRERL